MPEARYLFRSILKEGSGPDAFRSKVTMILEHDPYYIPCVLEHLWFAERDNDLGIYNEILEYSKRITRYILISETGRRYATENWTKFELSSLKEVLERQLMAEPVFIHRIFIRFQQYLASSLPIQTITTEESGRYLRMIKVIDPTSLRDEIDKKPPYFWNVNTSRAKEITYHKHTRTIVLRQIRNFGASYTPYDGVHESVPTTLHGVFPKISKVVEDFAIEQNLALGRVAIVALLPGQQSYRHFDDEVYTYLHGRRRFHLVIQTATEDILSSGTETAKVSPGEIWFIDNSVMHRAYNSGGAHRIHVIFDGLALPDTTPS